MRPNRGALVAALVLILFVVGLAAYYEVTLAAASSGFVTGTGVGTTSDIFGGCAITSIGEFQLRIVSDYTGLPVSRETISAVDTEAECSSVTRSNGTARVTVTLSPSNTAAAGQVVYLDNFSAGKGGWLTPIFPVNAIPAGDLNFTVAYQGRTYNFSESVPPIGSECVTLHVPSGSVTTKTIINGNGSYFD